MVDTTDDPLGLDPTLPEPSQFRRWLARSTPVGTLLALGFVLLILSNIFSQTLNYFERKAEREEGRQELLCRSQFTNDVTQAEGVTLLSIQKLVIGSVSDDDAAVLEQVKLLKLQAPIFERALARREDAEEVCAGRPAS